MPLHVVILPTLAFFVTLEVVSRKIQTGRGARGDGEVKEPKILNLFYVVVWLFVVCLALSLFVVWWGVIKRAIMRGSGM